jgi:type IV secretion system protein VirB9
MKTLLIAALSAALLSPSLALAATSQERAATGTAKRSNAGAAAGKKTAAAGKKPAAGKKTAAGTKPAAGKKAAAAAKPDAAKKTAAGSKSKGGTQFVFDERQQPGIVCAVRQVCDVALQPGERVGSINLGDTAGWSVKPAAIGSGPNEVQHLIIKPLDTGLETSLVVTTDRRAYHLRLRSHGTEYMPQISFTYPKEAPQRRATPESAVAASAVAPAGGAPGTLGNLAFDYDLSGSADWKPVRVYNDGRRTILEMPGPMESAEAPTLLVMRREGGEDAAMVNYRVQGHRYIVDTVIDRAILIAGAGSSQDRVTIQRRR